MQYLLTEKEYDDLMDSSERGITKHEKALQEFCTWVADNTRVFFWGNKEPKIWGCILSGRGHGYCDYNSCPSLDMCPHPDKRFSK